MRVAALQRTPCERYYRRLKIAEGTVKVHLHNVFQKLEISNRTALGAFVTRRRVRSVLRRMQIAWLYSGDSAKRFSWTDVAISP
ncbi:LuxR C-terminal-related transcriptional regulator [Bradyrhizobium sp. ORS 111]|uniref:LuxR C-terminal-related transcriptional regulator n=1 Tax=Bradyrhizobium sp. ORS 111 TaxID=1685958 RepID=UPI00388DFDFA